MAKICVFIAILNLGQFLYMPIRVSASLSNKNSVSWKMQSSFLQGKWSRSSKPLVNEKYEWRKSQDWQRGCLQVLSNQTMEEARKEHLVALNQSLSGQLDLNKNVNATKQGTYPVRIRNTSDEKVKIMKKGIFFPNVGK